MKTMYLTGGYGLKSEITTAEVERSTEHFVFLPATKNWRAHRAAKSSEYTQYHETWEEAHAYLLAKAERRLESARASLASAQGHYGNVKGMRPAAPAERSPEGPDLEPGAAERDNKEQIWRAK